MFFFPQVVISKKIIDIYFSSAAFYTFPIPTVFAIASYSPLIKDMHTGNTDIQSLVSVHKISSLGNPYKGHYTLFSYKKLGYKKPEAQIHPRM